MEKRSRLFRPSVSDGKKRFIKLAQGVLPDRPEHPDRAGPRRHIFETGSQTGVDVTAYLSSSRTMWPYKPQCLTGSVTFVRTDTCLT